MFQEMNVAMKFFRDCVGRVLIQKRFQLRLFSWRSRQFSYILQIGRCYRISNEYWFDAGEIESVDVRSHISLCSGRGHLRLFAARLPIKRKSFPGEFVKTSVNFARTEV